MIIFGIVGLIIITIAVWLKNEVRQDQFFIFGGIFLLVYSIHIGDSVFIALQIIFIISSTIELIKIRKSR